MATKLTEVGRYPGIGRVLTRHDKATAFPSYEKICAQVVDGSRRDVFKRVLALQSNPEGGEIALTAEQFADIGSERLFELERNGIISTMHTPQNPLGQFALDHAPRLLPTLEQELEEVIILNRFEPDTETVFRLNNSFWSTSGFSLITQPAAKLSSEDIDRAPFKNISTTAKVIALCRKKEDGTWEWDESRIYPDANILKPSLTSGEQYGQLAFEGMVAMVNEQNEVILFRPEYNAARLVTSSQAIGVPPLSQEQYLDSVRHAVLANKNFLPSPGSESKLYIRPYSTGLGGGASIAIGDPEAFMFAIDVFPFGNYAGDKNAVIKIAHMQDERRALPGKGIFKIAGHYAGTIPLRNMAKSGELALYPDQKFNDVLFSGEGGKINELSSGNLFGIKQINEGMELWLPPLDSGEILAGNNREIVKKVAEAFGIKICEIEFGEEELMQMNGVFTSGTAMGAVRIGSITFKTGTVTYDQEKEHSEKATPATKAFFDLYNALYAIRKGEVDLNRLPQSKEWATVIGRIDQVT